MRLLIFTFMFGVACGQFGQPPKKQPLLTTKTWKELRPPTIKAR